MSSRYDPSNDEPKSVAAASTPSPLQPPSKAGLYKTLAAIGISAAIAIAAAFHFDLCGLLRGIGVSLKDCAASVPTP